jgi:peptide/nickel transport system ATP-binding protein/oligopeptide transport system ATP-binding protein
MPNLVSVRGLQVHFPIRKGFLKKTVDYVRAVDGVDFDIYPGQTVGLVGESGSGKSTVGRAIMRLVEPTEGSITYEGKELTTMNAEHFFPFRKRMQMIFQDPYSSLNPRMTIGAIMREPTDIHLPRLSRREKEKKIGDLLERCGLPRAAVNRYPHQFSGGQRQRIGIARALVVEPEFIICDEAVSALDVSVQAQIVNLLKDLQKERKLTYLFIAHDLAIVEHVSDWVLVMNQGKIVEQAEADAIYQTPRDPYTIKLLEAVPKMETIVAARAAG